MKSNRITIEQDAAIILASAAMAVQHIFAQRAALDRAGRKRAPLIANAGENHSRLAHHLHHVLVLDGLQKHEDVAVCCELPHDTAVRSVKALACPTLETKRLAGIICKAPPADLDPKSFLAFTDFEMADHSGKTQMNFLLKRRLPTRFNDAAKIGEGRLAPLDHRDSSTEASLMACFQKAAAGVVGSENPGMYVRNRHMVDGAAVHIRKYRPRILFQQCGNAHIADERPGALEQYSLPALFRKAGFSTVSMPLAIHESERDFFLSRHRGDAEAFVPTRLLSRIPALRQPAPGPLYQLNTRADEAEWLSTALSSIGRPDLILSIPDHDALKARYAAELRRHYLNDGPALHARQ